MQRELGSFPCKTVCYVGAWGAGQFDFHMVLEIPIIICKQQLFRREVHFHVKWKVDVLALQRLFRMKKIAHRTQQFCGVSIDLSGLSTFTVVAHFKFVASIPGSKLN